MGYLVHSKIWYLRIMRKSSHGQRSEPILEQILARLRFNKAAKYIKVGSIIADIGCGYNAEFLKSVSKKIKKGVGFDVSVTKKGLPENIALIKTDINKSIKEKINYFDAITALAVLEHVESPSKIIANTKNILKKGGELIITTPHKKLKPYLEFLSKIGLLSKDEIGDHKTYFTHKTLRGLLVSGGFKVIIIENFEMSFNIFALARKI